MNPIRFLSCCVLLAASLIFARPASADGHSPAAGDIQDALQALADSSAQTRHLSLGALSVRLGAGALVFGGEYDELHLAAGMVGTQGLVSGKTLSLSMECEVFSTTSLGLDVDVTTVPILLGFRAEMSPTGPARLYGTVVGGACIIKVTSSEWKIALPWLPIPYREISEDINVLFAYAPGGGLEVETARDRLFSIDYRYVVAGLGSLRGGHLVFVSYGFRF